MSDHRNRDFHDIDWQEVAQFIADEQIDYDKRTIPGGMCCPWCDLVANSGGGPTDEERAAIMRANRDELKSAPFWPAVARWLEARP